MMPISQEEAINQLINQIYGNGSGIAGPVGPQTPEEYLMSMIDGMNAPIEQPGVAPFLPGSGWRYSPSLFPVEIPSNGSRFTTMPVEPFNPGVPQGRIPGPVYAPGVPQGRIPVPPPSPGVPQGRYPMPVPSDGPSGPGPVGPVSPPAPPFLPGSGWRYAPSANPVNIPSSGFHWTETPPVVYPAGVPQGRIPLPAPPVYPPGVPQGRIPPPAVNPGVPQGRYPLPAPPVYPAGVPQGRIPVPPRGVPQGRIPVPSGRVTTNTSNTSRPTGTALGGYKVTSGGQSGVSMANGKAVPQSPMQILPKGAMAGGRWTAAADELAKANALYYGSGAAAIGGDQQGADVSAEEALFLSTPEGQAYQAQQRASASQAAAQRAAQQKYYSGLLSNLDQQLATTNASFDQRKQAITDLLNTSNTRLTDILGSLGTQTQAAGAATSQAYTDAAARQAALQQEFAASEAARAAGQAQTLGAFGVSPAGIERQFTPAQMVEAQRGALAQQQAADAALYANRGTVHAGLSSDVSTRNSQQAAQLQAQLDYQRQIAAQQAAAQRAQLAAEAAAAGVTF